jgi:hypothetical protein
MLLRLVLRFMLVLAALALPGQALASGGNYVFDGGSAKERTAVRSALDASSFNWSIVPGPVTIHIARIGTSYATPGSIWLDGQLLASGRFAWAIVQHEYAHQVDFLLLGSDARRQLQSSLGGRAYCGEVAGVAHGDNTCERFASLLAWAYWPSRDNSLRPASAADEAGAMPAAAFRALLATLVGPPVAASSTVASAPAPHVRAVVS